MATIGERLLARDRELFVGRAVELSMFDRLLDGMLPQRVVHLVGPGGIGKSALLREVSRRGGVRGLRTVWVDGRDVPPFPSEIDQVFAEVRHVARTLVVLGLSAAYKSSSEALWDIIGTAATRSTWFDTPQTRSFGCSADGRRTG